MTTALVSTEVPWRTTDNVSFSNDNTSVGNETYYYDDTVKMFNEYTEFKVADFVNKYYLYVVCAIGIPGNIACIVTLLSMRPFLSSAVYMLTLAVVDIVAIALKVIYVQLTSHYVQLGDTGCQVIFFLGTVSQQYSNWILVAMTVERFIAIWFPFKVKTVCTRRNAAIALTIMLLFFTLANIQFVFTFEEVSDPQSVWQCTPRAQYMNFITYAWYWIDGGLYAMLPILLIIVFNSLIIHTVRKSGKAQRDLTNRLKSKNDATTQQRQITMMLLTISAVFVILVLPNCLFFIVKVYWTWKETNHGAAQYFLVYQIVFVLSDLNHALNFYLYCLSGLKFRRKFVQIICCRKEIPRLNYLSAVASIGRTADMMKSMSNFSSALTANTTVYDKSPVKTSPNGHHNGRVADSSILETTNLLCDKSPAKIAQNGRQNGNVQSMANGGDSHTKLYDQSPMIIAPSALQNGSVTTIPTMDGVESPVGDKSPAKITHDNIESMSNLDDSYITVYDENPAKTVQSEQQNGTASTISTTDPLGSTVSDKCITTLVHNDKQNGNVNDISSIDTLHSYHSLTQTVENVLQNEHVNNTSQIDTVESMQCGNDTSQTVQSVHDNDVHAISTINTSHSVSITMNNVQNGQQNESEHDILTVNAGYSDGCDSPSHVDDLEILKLDI